MSDHPPSSGHRRVVHVSGDFPDPIEPFKTSVIKTLVDLTGDAFDHQVLSINRRPIKLREFTTQMLSALGDPRAGVKTKPFAYGTAIAYPAPSHGILHFSMLDRLGYTLADLLDHSDGQPGLLIGHKLTIEGPIVAKMSQLLGVPYGLCLQGDTDTKILAARPDLTYHFRRILHGAQFVLPFAPWALEQIEARLGKYGGEAHLLPCPTDLDQPMEPRMQGSGLLSVFHLKNHRRKNLRGMSDAMRFLRSSGVAPALSIIGGGTAGDRSECVRLTRDVPEIKFAGAMGREAVRDELNRATALLLPSLRESFGLVFVEALFAGTPVIYPADTAVDGFFDDCPFAIKVDARDHTSIAAGIKRAVEHEKELKCALKKWQESEVAKRFQRSAIAHTFSQTIGKALSQKQMNAP